MAFLSLAVMLAAQFALDVCCQEPVLPNYREELPSVYRLFTG